MNKHKSAQSLKLFFFVFLLVFWGMASLYIFLNYIPPFSLIAVALLVFIFVLSLTNLFPFAPWVSFLSSTLVFLGVVYSLLDNTREVLNITGIGVGVFLITTILVVLYNNRIHQIRQKHNQLQQVIDSLVIYDRKTSLMRWKFAKQALSTEIQRGRRYDTKLTMVLFEIWHKSQYPSEDLDRIHKEMTDIIQETIREDIDIAFIGERIGMILPETGHSGANILTERLIKKFNRKVDARISAGIASFPEDAVTEEEIFTRTEQAVKVAMNTDREIIAYNILEEEELAGDSLSEAEEDIESEEPEIQKSPEENEVASAKKDKRESGEEKQSLETEEETEAEPTATEEMKASKEEKKEKEESTEPIDVQKERPEEEDNIQILKNINLDEDEWVVWIQGFDQMADLVPLKKELLEIDHVQDINFLFLQENHLVLRLKSTLGELTETEQSIPGWKIEKANLDNHYLVISKER